MRHEELSFANLQLAGMLKSGIPLEGALRQLSHTMRRGQLQFELRELESQLASGTPLRDALGASRFPELYQRMILVGVQSNDLPGVLTLLADYYQRLSSIGRRLKGIMIYPAIVLAGSLALSSFLAVFFHAMSEELPQILGDSGFATIPLLNAAALVWMPVVILSVLAGTGFLALVLPSFRHWLRWHLPGFKEAGLAQFAVAMRLLLQAGTPLGDALSLLSTLERGTPLGRDLRLWQERLAAGHGRFPDIATGSATVPPLFCWLVSSSEENMAEGFRRASEIYQARSNYRVELLLYAALPMSTLFLGVMLVSQAYPVMRLFLQFGSVLDQLGK